MENLNQKKEWIVKQLNFEKFERPLELMEDLQDDPELTPEEIQEIISSPITKVEDIEALADQIMEHPFFQEALNFSKEWLQKDVEDYEVVTDAAWNTACYILEDPE